MDTLKNKFQEEFKNSKNIVDDISTNIEKNEGEKPTLKEIIISLIMRYTGILFSIMVSVSFASYISYFAWGNLQSKYFLEYPKFEYIDFVYMILILLSFSQVIIFTFKQKIK